MSEHTPGYEVLPKPTPGPWRVEDDRYVYGGYGFFQRIAETEGCTDCSVLDTTLADLHLIAAAPELLEALRAAVAAKDEELEVFRRNLGPYPLITPEWLPRARSAIARATGSER